MEELTELEKKRLLVTEAVLELRLARKFYEDEARRQTDKKLEPLMLKLAGTVRDAYEADTKHNRSALLRAMMTKDRATLNRYLDMSENGIPAEQEPDWDAVAPEVEAEPEDARFTYDKAASVLTVRDSGAEAVFNVDVWGIGQTFLYGETLLWNDDYSIRNEIVNQLDGKNLNTLDLPLAKEALAYIRSVA